ncbi:hypothetical protein MNBD_GAMMA12-2888 [hydrothermal vent metagenome]|uniref:Uncharacterized protein n=1 Tax=hydrothermal vent metagenome TaxID=652676 RepID=A0A3B0YCW9_9ZZZZ
MIKRIAVFLIMGLTIVLIAPACSSDKPQSSSKSKQKTGKRLPAGWFDTLGKGTWKEIKNKKNPNILIFDERRYFVIRNRNWVISQGKATINHDRGTIKLFNQNGSGLIRLTDWKNNEFKVKGYLPLVLGKLTFNSRYHLNAEDLTPPIPTSLLEAAKYGDLRAVKGYLSAGKKLESTDSKSLTPLALAVHHHHTRVALYLLKKGANIKQRSKANKSILEYAIEAEHVALVGKLLSKGADLNYKHDNKSSLFLRAFDGNSLAVIKLLVKHGANVNELDGFGYSALYRAMSVFSLSANKIVERLPYTHYLIDKAGIKAHSKDKHGRTVLFYAANLGLKKTVRYLLDKGVDPNQKDNEGKTVFDYIANSDKKKLVWPVLIKHKR